VSWLFSLHLNESEHPMKSIAVKGLPSSRFIEQQDARMFSSRQLYGFPIKQRTIAILVRSSPWRTGRRVECQKNRRDERSLANTITG